MSVAARRLTAAVDAVPLEVTRAGDAHRCVGGTHTRLGDGRQLCWAPAAALDSMTYAVDAEIADRGVPVALGRRTGITRPDVFWPLWTRAEARAKVRDVPILVWIGAVDWTHDGDLPGAHEVASVLTRRVDDLVVSHAVLPGPSSAPTAGRLRRAATDQS